MNANMFDPGTSVEVVGSSGQISLGKEFAGLQVLVEGVNLAYGLCGLRS
jgi:hypothetical protein